MGCVSSKQDINDQHPNLFQVTNVNDDRELVSPGQLEITESELILHQKGKTPLVWPLRTLRKYGFDQEIFTFECGRRCPTGEGIYAFQCKRAEQLFNIVQHNISRNVVEETNTNNGGDFLSGVGPPVTRRVPSQMHPENYLTPLSAPNVHTLRTYPAVRSVSGPMSPPPTTVSPPLENHIPSSNVEHNNNKRGSLISNTSFTTYSPSALDNNETQPNYANLGMEPSNSVEPYANMQCHVYMNVDAKEVQPSTKENETTNIIKDDEDDNKHCYANIDTKEIEQLRTFRSSLTNANVLPNSLPQTIQQVLRKVNYAKLDFDTKDESIANSQNVPPESPNRPKDSYAVIDFYRTNALSQSVNPTSMDIEEGVRKTRHNSSIIEVVTRTSSSLSD